MSLDWLSHHRAQVDCHRKVVLFQLSDKVIEFRGIRGDGRAIKARRLLSRGNLGFLAYILNEPKHQVTLEEVPVVREYPEVFPEKLDEYPPECELEFEIQLVAGTDPISRTPYRMAPAELEELRTQLRELLEQGFIQPSTSP